MAQIVTAQFVGQTSCGFVREKYYEIEISAGRSGCLCVRDVQGQGFCILCASCFVFWVMGTGRFTTGPAWRCAAGGCRVVLCPAALPIAQGGRGLFLW